MSDTLQEGLIKLQHRLFSTMRSSRWPRLHLQMFRVLSLGHPLLRTVLNTIVELDHSFLKCMEHRYRVSVLTVV
jgi:hypothetical protein